MARSKFADYFTIKEQHLTAGILEGDESLGFVYVIGSDVNGPVKIGSAKSVHARVDSLQCGNPNELFIFAAVCVLSHSPVKLELAAHKLAKEYHYRGEWFSLGPKDAVQIILKAARDKKIKHAAPSVYYLERHNRRMEDLEYKRQRDEEERIRVLRLKLGMD